LTMGLLYSVVTLKQTTEDFGSDMI
jgi:hypothetical protein